MFQEGSAQVNIEYVQGRRVDLDVRPETSSWLAAHCRNVIVPADVDRKMRQYDITVASAVQMPGLAECEIQSQFFRNKLSLIRLAAPSLDAQDLLKRKDIGINLAENIDDAARPHTAVEPPAFVNVIGDDSDRLVKRSHSAKM